MAVRVPLASWALLLSCVQWAAAGEGEAEPVKISTPDGQIIAGKLYGKAPTALILCHGRAYTDGADSFADEARALQARGLMCLAISFRGYPTTAPRDLPSRELDVVGACDFLVNRGARRIFVLGSSMGGSAALKALKALSAKPQFAGILILSAFDSEAVQGIAAPKLFVVAYDDRRVYAKMMAMFIVAAPPKQAVVFEKGGHGQALLKSHRRDLFDRIAQFTAAPTGGE